MMNGITIITPTGDRPESLNRCANYVSRFKDCGEHALIQWIIVDDGQKPSFVKPIISNLNIQFVLIRAKKIWSAGENTLALNILEAVPFIKFDKILFIEDDDWYGPNYLKQQVERLCDYDIVGEIPSRYYHVPTGRYRVFENKQHASLCQTAISRVALPFLVEICSEAVPDFIDVKLWQKATKNGLRQNLSPGRGVVGLKGLPGRPGIGIGHRLGHSNVYRDDWRLAADKAVLYKWIGADAKTYDMYRKERMELSI